MTRAGSRPRRSSTSPAPDVRTGTPGNARPSSSAVLRAPTVDERSRVPPQCGQTNPPPPGSPPQPEPHQRHRGAPPLASSAIGPWQRGQRAGSRHSGRPATAGSRAAGPARAPVRDSRAALAARQATDGRCARGSGPVALHLQRRRRRRRRGGQQRRTLGRCGRRPRHEPTGLDQLLHRDAAREPTGQQGGAASRRPGRAARRGRGGTAPAARCEEVVAVVPPRDQPEVVDGREGRGAGADDAPHVTAQHLQPRRVARLRALVGGQPHVPPVPSTAVSAASTRATSRWSGTTSRAPRPAASAVAAATASAARPVLVDRPAGQREPRRGRALPRGDPLQERRPGRVRRPRAGIRARRPAAGVGDPAASAFSAAAWRLGTARRRTSPRVPAYRAATAPGRREDLGREHRLGADDLAQRREPALVLGGSPRARRRTRRGPGRRTGPGPGPRAARRPSSCAGRRTRTRGRGAPVPCRRRPPPQGRTSAVSTPRRTDASGTAAAARRHGGRSTGTAPTTPRLPDPAVIACAQRTCRSRTNRSAGSAADGACRASTLVGALPRERAARRRRPEVRPKWP